MKIIPLDLAQCSPLESLNRGIVTFTSFISNDSRFLFLDDHLDRLLRGAHHLFPGERWMEKKKDVETFLKSEFIADHYFRLAIAEDALFFSKKIHQSKSLEVEVARALSLKSPSLVPAYLKNPHYLLAELELARAKKEGYSDVLFFEAGEKLAEASTSNVFVALDEKTILTPPASSTVLEGVVRKNLIAFLRREAFDVIETDVFHGQMTQALEVWLTNSVQGVRSVSRYEGQRFKGKALYTLVCDKFGRFGEKFFYE